MMIEIVRSKDVPLLAAQLAGEPSLFSFLHLLDFYCCHFFGCIATTNVALASEALALSIPLPILDNFCSTIIYSIIPYLSKFLIYQHVNCY